MVYNAKCEQSNFSSAKFSSPTRYIDLIYLSALSCDHGVVFKQPGLLGRYRKIRIESLNAKGEVIVVQRSVISVPNTVLTALPQLFLKGKTNDT